MVILSDFNAECPLCDCRNEFFCVKVLCHTAVAPAHSLKSCSRKQYCIILTGLHLLDTCVDISSHPVDGNIVTDGFQLCCTSQAACEIGRASCRESGWMSLAIRQNN